MAGKVQDKVRRSSPGLVLDPRSIDVLQEGMLIRDTEDNQIKTLLDGIYKSVAAIDVVDGAVPQWDGATSKWKKVFVPNEVKLTAGETILANHVVYVNPFGMANLAIGTLEDSELIKVIGVSRTDVTNGFDALILSNQVVDGFTGLVPGSVYYLSTVTPGAISTVPSRVQIGVAFSSTKLSVNIKQEARTYKYPFLTSGWDVQGSIATLLVTHNLRSTDIFPIVYDSQSNVTNVEVKVVDQNIVRLTVDADAIFTGSADFAMLLGGASTSGGGGAGGGTAIQVLGQISGSIIINNATGNFIRITLAGDLDITLPTPSGISETLTFEITQDMVGSHGISWGGAKVPEGINPPLSTSPGAVDIIEFKSNGISWLACNLVRNLI